MKIEIKEIEKISLAENEYLWITFDDKVSREEIDQMAKNMSDILPDGLKRKIVFGPDSLHLKKIEIKK